MFILFILGIMNVFAKQEFADFTNCLATKKPDVRPLFPFFLYLFKKFFFNMHLMIVLYLILSKRSAARSLRRRCRPRRRSSPTFSSTAFPRRSSPLPRFHPLFFFLKIINLIYNLMFYVKIDASIEHNAPYMSLCFSSFSPLSPFFNSELNSSHFLRIL